MGLPFLLAVGVVALAAAGCSSRSPSKRIPKEEEADPEAGRITLDRLIKQDPLLTTQFAVCENASSDEESKSRCKADAYSASGKVAVFRVGPVFKGEHFYVLDTFRDFRVTQGGPGQAVQILENTNPPLMATQDGAAYAADLVAPDGDMLALVGRSRIGFVNELSSLWFGMILDDSASDSFIKRDMVILEGGETIIADAPLYLSPGTLTAIAGYADKEVVEKLKQKSLKAYVVNKRDVGRVFDASQQEKIASGLQQGALNGQYFLRDKSNPSRVLVLRGEDGPFGGFGDYGLSLSLGQDMVACAQYYAQNMPGTHAVIKDPNGSYRVYGVEGTFGNAENLGQMEPVPLPSKHELIAVTGPDRLFNRRDGLTVVKEGIPAIDPKMKTTLSVLLLRQAMKKMEKGDQRYFLALQPEVVALADEKQRRIIDRMVRDRTIPSAEARDKIAMIFAQNPAPPKSSKG